MKRAYEYAGLKIVVETESVFEQLRRGVLASVLGHIALVHVASASLQQISGIAKLPAPGAKLFASEGEALMAGHGAGQRLIDAMLKSKDVPEDQHKGST
jgi:hypothetical protein